jgi:UPF0755 protein
VASPQSSVNRARTALVGVGFAIIVGVGVIVGAASLWFRDAVYGAASLPTATTDVVIPKGASFSDVVATLEEKKVLAHPLAFRLLARLRHVDSALKAGEYRFPPRQTTDEVLRRLVRGEQIAVWVTIPEGFTAKQIAQTLAEHNVGSAATYETLFSQHGLVIDGTRTPDMEGYLFPSTYLIPIDQGPQAVANIFVDQFRRELPHDAAARARALGRTVPEVVTVASLVEREGKVDDERPLIASVIYNRLRLGMPLEVDASIEYALPEHHDVITKRDLAIDSPYNTYQHAGLPPTPIANPGKPSLDAAFFPAHTEYLYYVAKGDGHHAFAKTLSEHNANVARYLK